MVFFNCNACGEALKKSAVEKHYTTKCRQCEVLSCVDCGKDFYGDEYQKHVKCITEEEKYSGKDFKPKANANKGEKKQELWTQQVHEAIQKASGNVNLRNILQKLVDYPNIPRKQAKFENFLKNSLRVHNPGLTKQVWELMSASINKPETTPQQVTDKKLGDINGNLKDNDMDTGELKVKKDKKSSVSSLESEPSGEAPVKKSKREKKEERREKANKKQKKDKCAGKDEEKGTKRKPEHDEEEMNGKNKKKKKRKHAEIEENAEQEVKPKKSKKKKTSVEDDDNDQPEPEVIMNEIEDVETCAMTPGKFKWETTIVKVLRKQDDKELPLKKLRKKVLNEYYTLVAEKNRLSEEQVLSKFDKKLYKNAKFKVQKERVKLLN